MKIRNARLQHGHAPGHVRDTFIDAVGAFLEWELGEPKPTVIFQMRYVPHTIPISRACTLLWHCTDVVPGSLFDELTNELGVERRTYAACAHAMHAAIKERERTG